MTRGQWHIPDRAHPAQGAWHDAGPDDAWQLFRLLSHDRLEHDHWAMPMRQYVLNIPPALAPWLFQGLHVMSPASTIPFSNSCADNEGVSDAT